MSAYRCREILVTQAIYEALQARAEVDGLDCPDAAAELLLGRELSKDGLLTWLIAKRKTDAENRREEYATRLQAQRAQEDQIP